VALADGVLVRPAVGVADGSGLGLVLGDADGAACLRVRAGAGAAGVVSPAAIAVPMAAAGIAAGGQVLLTAGAGTGIVAVGGSAGDGEWAGVSDLALPYPPLPPPDPPVLLSARFDSLLARLTLAFDRAVDTSGVDVAAFVVNDGRDTHASYAGGGVVSTISAESFFVSMVNTGAYEGLGMTLIVSAENGVVSAADDAPWGGVAPGDAIPLPAYPPALVVAASCDGSTATLWFDAPVWLNGVSGGGGPTPDDAIRFNGITPSSVVQAGDDALQFAVPTTFGPDSWWTIDRQPAWVGADVAAPQAGTFP
jgi:hypothetical protein